MITAEEILEGITGYVNAEIISIPKKWIYQAMEQYANQSAATPPDVEQMAAGEAWRQYIKQYPKLDEFWQSIPEVANLWLSQQIDIFAGKYPNQAGQSAVQPKKVTVLMDIDSNTIDSVYLNQDQAIEVCRVNRNLAPFTFGLSGQSAVQDATPSKSKLKAIINLLSGEPSEENAADALIIAEVMLAEMGSPDVAPMDKGRGGTQPNDWVSVNDKMPQVNQWVICSYGGGIILTLCQFDGEGLVPYGQQFKDENITHWMLLPTPPESGEQTK